MAEGREILTVEGLDGEALNPVQQAFVDHNAFQCSFCTPGFVLMSLALLREVPLPTRDEIRSYLSGNLCRCGSYLKIEEAVIDAAGRLAEPADPSASG
jgi:aerobic-type carbon monoxide dehydrogenase small subunit (CoxS/CutS family)